MDKDFVVDGVIQEKYILRGEDFVADNVIEEKYILRGEDFKKLIKNAKNFGAESLDYSSRKNNKYMVKLPGGKKVHFGSPKYEDFTIHKDKERRDKYLARATKIKNKKGEFTYTNPESPNFWSVNLLW